VLGKDNATKEDFEFWINDATKRDNGLYYYRFSHKFMISPKKLLRFFSESPNLVLSDYIVYTDTYYPPVWNSNQIRPITYVSSFTFMYLTEQQISLLSKNKKDDIARAIEAGIGQGKINATYITYIIGKNRQERKLNEWFSKHPQFVRVKTEQASNATKIYFINAGEEDIYKAENEKILAFEDARTVNGNYYSESMKKQIAVFKKYPDFTPLCFDGQRFWAVDDKKLVREFLSTFPECNDQTVKNEYIAMMKKWGIPVKEIVGFIEAFQDYQAAEDIVYLVIKDMGSKFDHNWVKQVIPHLVGHVDITRILNTAIDHKYDSESTLITKYIDYTGDKYFSKKSLNEYFASTATFLQLIKEINNCTPLIQQRPKTAENMFQPFISYRLDKEGVTIWQQLFSDFLDKKSEILSIIRNKYVSSAYYSKRKWSSDIQSRLSEANSIKNNLNAYINAAVPDSEGIKLAKQYLVEVNNVISRYNADLPQARSYESSITSQISRIQKEVENTSIVPPYRVRNRKQYNEFRDWIDIYITPRNLDLYNIDYEYKSGIYYGNGISKSDNARTLDEFVLKYVKNDIKVILWGYRLDTEGLEKAESIIKQYNQYGIREWYKIDWWK
jgi:hypothetical protein